MKLALGILRAILKLAIFIGTAFFLMQPFVAIITTFAGTGTTAQRFTGFGSNLLHLVASLVLFYSGTIAIIAFSDKYSNNRILQLVISIVGVLAMYGISIVMGNVALWLITAVISILKYVIIGGVILTVIILILIKWLEKNEW